MGLQNGDTFALNTKPIQQLKYGGKAKSIFKYGLEHIASALLNPYIKEIIEKEKVLSCT